MLNTCTCITLDKIYQCKAWFWLLITALLRTRLQMDFMNFISHWKRFCWASVVNKPFTSWLSVDRVLSGWQQGPIGLQRHLGGPDIVILLSKEDLGICQEGANNRPFQVSRRYGGDWWGGLFSLKLVVATKNVPFLE